MKDNISESIIKNLNESVLTESDATEEFITDLKNLLNKYCRVEIGSMTLENNGDIVNIDGKKVDIGGDSNLAAILDIVKYLSR